MSADRVLPILNLFPLVEKPQDQMSALIAEMRGEPVIEPRTYADGTELVSCIITEGFERAGGAYDAALRSSKLYRNWQEYFPYLRDVPNIRNYQRLSRQSLRLADVDREIIETGRRISSGQVLYRGMRNIQVQSPSVEPLSTSIHPRVAWWHATEVKGFVAIMKFVNDKTRVYVYRTTGNRSFKQEKEVLVLSGLHFRETSSINVDGMDIKNYDVWGA